jgi:integrase
VDLDKSTLQTYLNELEPNFSKSVLAKTRVYLNSMLFEAVELEFLPKNPAAKLFVPRSGKKAANLPLTPEQIPQVLFHLGNRDRLIVRMFLVLGLRPEMFALRWNDKQGNSLRIDTAIVDGIEVETKSEGSDAAVWLPPQSKRSSNSGGQPAGISARSVHPSFGARNGHQHEQFPVPRA